MRYGKPISILVGPYNQDGTSEITTIFDQKLFNSPKPQELIQYLLSWVFNSQDNKNGIILDSFAGSGTTAHAVLNLNKKMAAIGSLFWLKWRTMLKTLRQNGFVAQ